MTLQHFADTMFWSAYFLVAGNLSVRVVLLSVEQSLHQLEWA